LKEIKKKKRNKKAVHFRKKKRGNFTEPIYRERKGERVEEMDDAIQKFRPPSLIKKTFISRLEGLWANGCELLHLYLLVEFEF